MKISESLRQYSGLAILAFIFIYAACVLFLYQQDLLFAAQDMAVWRSDATFFEYYLQKPFGLLQYSALFFTQFFYYPWLGILLLLWIWLLCTIVSSYAFSTNNGKSIFTLSPFVGCPVLCLLVSITQMGYWIYYLKLPSYWFLPTLLWLWWSVALLLTFKVKKEIVKVVCLLAWIAVLTPWNGFTLFLFDEPDAFFYITFYVMAATLLADLFVNGIVYLKKLPLRMVGIICSVILLFGSSIMNYRNACFQSELRMQQYAESADWQNILGEMSSLQRKPTRQMVLMRDVALLNTNHLNDTTLYTCDATIPQMLHGPKVHMAFTAAPILYFSCGYINDAYRWTFENGVEYGLSPRRLRMLLRCSLLNHEWQLSQRYIRLLRQTLFHSHFADELQPLVGHPELFSRHPELMLAQRYRQKTNILTPANQYCERILLSHPNSPLFKHSSWHFQGQTSVKLY